MRTGEGQGIVCLKVYIVFGIRRGSIAYYVESVARSSVRIAIKRISRIVERISSREGSYERYKY